MDYTYTLQEPLVVVEGLSVTLGGRAILRDLAFTVHNVVRPGLTQGQIVGLLGPSGCGKTTLFKRLAGFEAVEQGKIETFGGHVGVVMQHYPLFNHRSVMDNLLIAGRQARLTDSESRTKAQGYLDTLGVAPHAASWPANLSGGQRQRVAIAQQLMAGPKLLLMDEPFSGLDVRAKHAACDLLEAVAAADETTTLMVITHDIASAVRICDQILVLGPEGDQPGSHIVRDIDLKAMGLAWRPREHRAGERALVQEIEAQFLAGH